MSMTGTQNSPSLAQNQSLDQPTLPPLPPPASGSRGSTPHGPCGWPLSERLTWLPLRTCNQGGSQEEGGNDRLKWPAEEGDWQTSHEKSLNQEPEPCRARDERGLSQLSAPPPTSQSLFRRETAVREGKGLTQGHPTNNPRRRSLLRAPVQQRQVPGTPLWARIPTPARPYYPGQGPQGKVNFLAD